MIPAQLLAQVPGCDEMHPPLAVQVLPGGYGRNEVLRVDTPQGRFVWRRRLGAVDRPGALALTELRAHRAAAAAGLAPRIIAAAVDGAWIVMEFVDSPPWTDHDLHSADGVERLGTQLARLHALPVPAGVPTADAPAMARGYQLHVHLRDPAAAQQLAPAVERVDQLTAELAGSGAGSALVHGDLMVSNMLGPQPLLVDWEYAQVADPTWDCACLLSYYPFLEPQLPRLLGSAGLGAGSRVRLNLQRERFNVLNSLWERAYSSPCQGHAG